jgi:hypothetical protein
MANFTNFQSDINALSVQYDKFLVSRIIPSDLSSLLEIQVPAGLPTNYFVQISLYSLFDNSLVFNTAAYSNTQNQFFTEVLQYNSAAGAPLQTRRLLFIDFSKIVLDELELVPDGELRAVFNFFTEEFGNYNTQSLHITEISPSRREVELKLLPEYNTSTMVSKLLETSRPQINSEFISPAVAQIFGRPAPQIPSDNTVFNYSFVTSSDDFPTGLPANIIQQIQNITNTILTQSYHRVTQSINEQLAVPNNKRRFTDIYLHDIISQSISQSYAAITSPTQFDLV